MAGEYKLFEIKQSYSRRVFKKVSVAGAITLHHRYLYRGYVQIATIDMTRSGLNGLWMIFWDPSQPTATRPLAIQIAGTWFTYELDLTKNVCELYKNNGGIATAYTYTPFVQSTAVGTTTQPLGWSSEFMDGELDLVYYNYRHYNPQDGRWINRDPIGIQGGYNLYGFVGNNSIYSFDQYGLSSQNTDPCIKCKRYLSQKEHTHASLIIKIRKKCNLQFKCEKLSDKPGEITLGYTTRLDNRWNPFSRVSILIVINCCIGATQAQSSPQDTFTHELVHAIDHCNNDDPDQSCRASVCSELKAYAVGGCKGKRGSTLRACLKNRVPASSLTFCKNERTIERLIDENYEKCLKGYPI